MRINGERKIKCDECKSTNVQATNNIQRGLGDYEGYQDYECEDCGNHFQVRFTIAMEVD